ncbi:hypothetical protein BH09VER1_BH09VER1_55280 [soil metagenome]
MKNPPPTLIVLTICAILTGGGRAHADSNLVSYFFENETDTSLWTAPPASSQTSIVGNTPEVLPVTQGRNCMEFSMTGTSAGSRGVRTASSIPVPSGTSRRIELSFDIRSQNCNPNDLVVRLLQQDASGGSTWVMSESDYMRVAPSKGWVTLKKIGALLDTTTKLYLYVYQTNAANSTGKIWLDNVAVTLLGNNTDYLVEAYSGGQGNIFQADTGTMTVRSNDPRYSTLSVQVFDHAGAPVAPSVATVGYSTLEGHKIATIAFNEKGFYDVEASPNGSMPFMSWTAATIGAPVTASATEPLGIFSVNSDNPLAEAAGSEWNRFFLQTELVYKNGTSYSYPASYSNAQGQYAVGTNTTLPSSMLYYSQSTNQKWIVCLRGIPDWLVDTTPVHHRDNVNFNFQWQYYNDQAQFITFMTWVLKDLPANVQYVEAMNEPEWNQWGGTWTELGNYIKALKLAVNQANVGRALPLKLLGPCFAHLPTTSFPDNNLNYPPFTNNKALLDDLLLTQNVLASLDGIVMHIYHTGNSSNMPEADFTVRLDQFKTYLGTTSFGNKPLLFTEYGWQSGTQDWQVPVSEALQAAYMSRAMLITLSKYDALSFNITAMLSFALKFGGYSFLEADDNPDLPYVAYARTAKEVEPYSGTRKMLSLGFYNAFTATNNVNKTVLALWAPSGSASVITIPSISSSARDLYGHPKTLSTTPKQVTINGSPTFITVDDSALGNWVNGLSYTVPRGGSVPVEFTDMIAFTEFSLSGSTLSVSGTSNAGVRTILGKSGAFWKKYTITVN